MSEEKVDVIGLMEERIKILENDKQFLRLEHDKRMKERDEYKMKLELYKNIYEELLEKLVDKI